MSARHAVLVEVANLSDTEKDLLCTTIAVLTDPALGRYRKDLIAGRLALTVEEGEVVWINPSELQEAITA